MQFSTEEILAVVTEMMGRELTEEEKRVSHLTFIAMLSTGVEKVN